MLFQDRGCDEVEEHKTRISSRKWHKTLLYYRRINKEVEQKGSISRYIRIR